MASKLVDPALPPPVAPAHLAAAISGMQSPRLVVFTRGCVTVGADRMVWTTFEGEADLPVVPASGGPMHGSDEYPKALAAVLAVGGIDAMLQTALGTHYRTTPSHGWRRAGGAFPSDTFEELRASEVTPVARWVTLGPYSADELPDFEGLEAAGWERAFPPRDRELLREIAVETSIVVATSKMGHGTVVGRVKDGGVHASELAAASGEYCTTDTADAEVVADTTDGIGSVFCGPFAPDIDLSAGSIVIGWHEPRGVWVPATAVARSRPGMTTVAAFDAARVHWNSPGGNTSGWYVDPLPLHRAANLLKENVDCVAGWPEHPLSMVTVLSDGCTNHVLAASMAQGVHLPIRHIGGMEDFDDAPPAEPKSSRWLSQDNLGEHAGKFMFAADRNWVCDFRSSGRALDRIFI